MQIDLKTRAVLFITLGENEVVFSEQFIAQPVKVQTSMNKLFLKTIIKPWCL